MPHIFTLLRSVSCPKAQGRRKNDKHFGGNYSFFISYNSKPHTDEKCMRKYYYQTNRPLTISQFALVQ